MILGSGDIASAIKDNKKLLFFASGVSNSKETRESEYEREENLLLEQNPNKHIVYFSSLCVFYSHTRYAQHKNMMESIIKDTFKHYTIMRLGNITWGNNPNTIINYFRNEKKNKRAIEIRDEYRYIITKEEFQHWLSLIPYWNCEMNITGRMLSIKKIVKEFV